jgi:hypothetical protein
MAADLGVNRNRLELANGVASLPGLTGHLGIILYMRKGQRPCIQLD